jgi:hypothetical protein
MRGNGKPKKEGAYQHLCTLKHKIVAQVGAVIVEAFDWICIRSSYP